MNTTRSLPAAISGLVGKEVHVAKLTERFEAQAIEAEAKTGVVSEELKQAISAVSPATRIFW